MVLGQSEADLRSRYRTVGLVVLDPRCKCYRCVEVTCQGWWVRRSEQGVVKRVKATRGVRVTLVVCCMCDVPTVRVVRGSVCEWRCRNSISRGQLPSSVVHVLRGRVEFFRLYPLKGEVIIRGRSWCVGEVCGDCCEGSQLASDSPHHHARSRKLATALIHDVFIR